MSTRLSVPPSIVEGEKGEKGEGGMGFEVELEVAVASRLVSSRHRTFFTFRHDDHRPFQAPFLRFGRGTWGGTFLLTPL